MKDVWKDYIDKSDESISEEDMDNFMKYELEKMKKEKSNKDKHSDT